MVLQWRIRHSEAGANVLGNQFDGRTISVGIGFHEVFHGRDQQALTINVTRVRSAMALEMTCVRTCRNYKNLTHETSYNR